MTESIIGVLAWTILAVVVLAVVSFGVFGLILGSVPARHCEHGVETEDCPECQGLEERDLAGSPSGADALAYGLEGWRRPE